MPVTAAKNANVTKVCRRAAAASAPDAANTASPARSSTANAPGKAAATAFGVAAIIAHSPEGGCSLEPRPTVAQSVCQRHHQLLPAAQDSSKGELGSV
ncbi:hypothetical protein GCM10011404_12110 [Sphingomonas prati]|nr:hypothetical protein GCM10011404_12110 [Sphingomonas prati]